MKYLNEQIILSMKFIMFEGIKMQTTNTKINEVNSLNLGYVLGDV